MQTNEYVEGLGPQALAKHLSDLVAVRRQSLWLVCRYLADLADCRGYLRFGQPDVYAYAWRELGMSARCVRERIRVGRALRSLPEIEASFVRGELGFARVREIVRVATPETEREWRDAAMKLPRRLLEAMVSRTVGEPEPPSDPVQPDDRVELCLLIPAATWRDLEAALAAARSAEGADLSDEAALAVVAAEARRALCRAVPNLEDLGAELEADDPVGSWPEDDDDPAGAHARPGDDGDPLGSHAEPGADDPVGSREPRGGERGEQPGSREDAPPEEERPGIRPQGAQPDCPGPEARRSHASAHAKGPCAGASPFRRDEVQPFLIPETARVLELLDARGLVTVSELERLPGMSVTQLLAALGELEVEGLAEKLPGAYRRLRFQPGGDG